MKKSLLTVLLVSMSLIACSKMKSDLKTVYVAVPAVPPVVTPVDPVASDISALIADENAYRLGLGQSILSSGLSCVLYTTTGGDRIQSSIVGHNTLTGLSQVAAFLLTTEINQPDSPISVGMGVLPLYLRSIYQNMYLLRCQGQIVVRESGYVQFDLTSDDASLLYIDGAKVIDSDNNHGSVLVSGSKYLRRGVHVFRLDYAQAGGGGQSLILKANGEIIHPMFLFH